jgi:hypothetical protein
MVKLVSMSDLLSVDFDGCPRSAHVALPMSRHNISNRSCLQSAGFRRSRADLIIPYTAHRSEALMSTARTRGAEDALLQELDLGHRGQLAYWLLSGTGANCRDRGNIKINESSD